MTTTAAAGHTPATPGHWRVVKVLNKARETRLAVARNVGARLEYVCSASGKRSTFCTAAGAAVALRAAIARATEPQQ